jgi:hypothetical protein
MAETKHHYEGQDRLFALFGFGESPFFFKLQSVSSELTLSFGRSLRSYHVGLSSRARSRRLPSTTLN